MLSFSGILEKYDNTLWNFHIKVPEKIVSELDNQNIKRFLCQINQGAPFYASQMPAGNHVYFLKIDKELRAKYSLKIGIWATTTISKDERPYGIPLSEEMKELLSLDLL